ncbi:MAG TPA: methyl-accepting chemotaxis protein [Selenomonadales bacterium]|nr:methyl-accepting chemotaxis protein [Selenomonadales bacterium]
MPRFRNLKTANKIISLIIMMVFFTGLVGYIGFYYIGHIKKTQTAIYQEHLLPVKWLNAASAQSRAVEAITMEVLLANLDKAKQQKLLNDAKTRMEEVEKLLGDYEKTIRDPKEEERFAALKMMLDVYHRERHKAVELALAGNNQEAYTYFAQNAAPHIGMINDELEESAHRASEEAAMLNEHSEKEAMISVKVTIAVTILTMLASLALGLVIARTITKPLTSVSSRIQNLAEGDLTSKAIDYDAKDEIGQLSVAFNTMTANLTQLIRQVIQSAAQVAAASEELTAGAQQSAQASTQIATSIMEVTQGSERQLITVSKTSAVIESISSGIQQVAENATNAVGMADASAGTAQKGSQAVVAAIDQMKNIENAVTKSADVITKLGDRSKEIGQIIDTISGIAEQTNLLAFNAAIEAARAGEQGRGFSVVAEEVRKLAGEAQSAAQQIAALISEVQDETAQAVVAMNAGMREVKTGAEVVNTAGDAFAEIASLVTKVSTQVSDISLAIQDIAKSSRQIVSAMQEIEQVSKNTAGETQTVSAAVEEQSASMQEIAASSQSLAQMAQKLENAVQRFKV